MRNQSQIRERISSDEAIPVECSIPDRFREMAGKFPSRPSLKSCYATLTYEELNRESDRIARALIERGLTADERVALLIGRSPQLYSAIIGVLKSGNAYVPLDTSYPQERLSYIIGDSQPSLILCDEHNSDLARELAQSHCRAVCFDDLKAESEGEISHAAISPDAMAFLIYTSGSTGQPKGVIRTHRNVMHSIGNFSRRLRVTFEDRLSLFFSPSFGASQMGMYGALMNGASFYDYDFRREGLASLSAWLDKEEITIIHLLPKVFRHFAESLEGGDNFPRLRAIALASEPMSRREVESFRRRFSSSCALINHYAASETGLISQYRIDDATQIIGNIVPVGYPVEGYTILILDDDGREADCGQTGEIAIRGRHLSPGYWNRPDLTRAAFIEDASGARIYRTGDTGRLREDGCLEHFGRKGSRVKIRGYAVELAEVEMALLNLSGVREAAVAAREDSNADLRLVAWIVADRKRELSIDEMRKSLAEALPDFMIPSLFVPLEELPRNANGKVDRARLPAPQEAHAADDAPATETEKRLIRLWEPVLGIEGISASDNFFDLGGHSISAMRLAEMIAQEFGRTVFLAALFGSPTVREMAALLDDPRSEPLVHLVGIQHQGRKPPLFCVHNIAGFVLSYRNLAAHLGADQPFYAFQAHNPDENRFYYPTVEELAARYIEEMTRLRPDGPYLIGGHSFGGLVAYEMACQMEARGQRVALLALFDTSVPGFERRPPLPDLIRLVVEEISALRLIEVPRHLWGKMRLRARMRRALWKLADRFGLVAKLLPHSVRTNFDAAHLRASREFKPQAYSGKISLFKVTSRRRPETSDPGLGWSSLAKGGVEIYETVGKHQNMIQEPFVGPLAELLNAAIEKAVERAEVRP